MSAKDRAFSKLDRESLQDAIEANNPWAKEWVRKREEKLSFLENAVDANLIQEANEALLVLPGRLNYSTQQDVVKVLWDIIDTRSIFYRLLKRPENVKVAAPLITKELESALEKLASAGVWTRRAIES